MFTVIGSLKGGSGKSTVTFNLAIWLAGMCQKVELFDLDPQLTLTDVLSIRKEDDHKPLPKTSHPSVATLNKKKFDDSTHYLADISIGDAKRMDAALSLADKIIIPVPPSQADVWSLQRFLERVGSVCGNTAPLIQVFINRADTHISVRETDETADALSALTGVHLLNPRLGQRTVFRRSFSEGLAVFELEPKGKASQEFTRLAKAVFPQIKPIRSKTKAS